MTKRTTSGTTAAALGAGLALALTGCAVERDLGAYDEAGYQDLRTANAAEPTIAEPYDGLPDDLDLGGASLQGEIGPVGVDDPAWVDGYADGQYASVYSTVDEARNGAVMTIFDIEGGLDHPDLAPGAHLTYRPEDLYRTEAEAAFVTVVGCAGAEAGSWDFDQTADVVTVEVSEGEAPGQREFQYTARFDEDGTSTVVNGVFFASGG